MRRRFSSQCLALLMVMVPALGVASCARTPPSPQRFCQANLSAAATVLVVDRTTRWIPRTTKRFNDGVPYVIGDPNTLGELKFAELRSSEAQVTTEDLGTCMLPIRSEDYAALSEETTSPALVWLGDIFRPCNVRDEDRAYYTKDCKPLRAQIELMQPDSARGAIDRQLALDVQPTATTDIARSLVAVISDACGARARCTIFIFSDMIDDEVRRELARNDDPVAVARAYANKALADRGRYSGRLTVVAWGFGRDEKDPQVAISSQQRAKLGTFWKAFFPALSAGGACVSLNESLQRVQETPLDAACPAN